MERLYFVMIVLAISGIITFVAGNYNKKHTLKAGVYTSITALFIYLVALYFF